MRRAAILRQALKGSRRMFLSVILSTYNAPVLLEKVLAGYGRQKHRDFEIVIADDGSTGETRELIDRLRQELVLPIEHVWHEDRGFLKCAILNRAIEASRGDYLLFSDGDCIPRADFLTTHVALAEPGHFLSGGYFKLPRPVSEALSKEAILRDLAVDLRHLKGLGLPFSPKNLRLLAGPRLARVLDATTPTKPTWNGHNASGWRRDILAANGFDERMRYGGEDRELGERLENAGIRGKQIRHRALCVHLWHERGYVRQEHLEANREIRRHTVSEGLRRTVHGIVQEG